MALFKASEVKRYRYKISQCTLIFGKETVDVKPEAVGGLMIEENFASALYPVFRLNVATDADAYYKISKYKTTMTVHLTIHKYYVRTDVNGHPTKESSKKIWIDDTFCIITKDIAVDKSTDLSLTENQLNVNSGDMEDRNYISELYLWRAEIANGFRKILNKVIRGSTMSTIISWALSNAGITNCIMSPLENNGRRGEVLVPPLPINRLLQHLDAMYGFYRNGSLIYFGIKTGYILNFNGKCTVWERGEERSVTILIPKLTVNASSGEGGTVDKGDSRHYIYMRYMDADFSSPSTVDNVVGGTDALVMNKTTASTSRSTGKSKSAKNNTNVISNSTENPWVAQIFAAQKSSTEQVLSGILNNVDLDDLTPNKVFTIAVEDPSQTKNAKGNYKLFSAIHKFVNDRATGDFAVESVVEFRRMSL